jgi:hypothetical protein
MALTSPGVEVTVIDESFYTPAEPGTTPLIVVATAQDKTNAAGTGVAAATSAANAGNAFKVTSQKELVDLFGVPNFEKTASNTPIHGSELNEYGLLAAYSLLGVSNAAFITRANVDLNQLQGSAEAPGANPPDGTWWINTDATQYGIQEWNSAAISTTGGQKFAAKTPIVLTDADAAKIENNAPKGSVGSIGDYAVVFETVGETTFSFSKDPARIYLKSAGNTAAGVAAGDWVLVGSQDWRASIPTIISNSLTNANVTTAAGAFTINGTSITIGGSNDTVDKIVNSINDNSIAGISAKNVSGRIYIYTDGTSNGNLNTITIAGLTTVQISTLGILNSTYKGPVLAQTPHTTVPQWKGTPGDGPDARPTGSVWIKTTEPNNGSRWRASKWSSATSSWVSVDAPLYANGHSAIYSLDRSGAGINLAIDNLFVQTNAFEHGGFDDSPATAVFRVWRRAATGATTITSTAVSDQLAANDDYQFEIAESIQGQEALNAAIQINFDASGDATDANTMAAAINAAGFTNIQAAVAANNAITISHKTGGEFRLRDVGRDAIGALFTPYNIDTLAGSANFYNLSDASLTGGQTQLAPGADDSTAENRYLASNWQPLSASDFYASADNPEAEPADGQLWYNPEFSEVDIMIHDGTTWVGYRSATSPYVEAASDRVGYTPIVSASNPYVSGTTIEGDIWISTADIENYPTIYKYDNNLSDTPASERWVLIDKTDQTSEDGILFADARYGAAGATGNTAASIKDLQKIDFLDPDAPDPALYPQNMLLWNLRRSGGNVKRYANNYIDITADNTRFNDDEAMTSYATDRWVTESGNNEDGSGSFGRKAQRKVVVQRMKSAIDTSSEIRDEERRNFNIIAAPGYPELMSNLVNLNIDRGLTAFVIGDTPLRLAADATTLTNWGSNANLVTDNGDDGIVTFDEYIATFYPNGFTTDLSGANAVVPASHMMMRTIALSDQVSFPWFAPAGTRRGGISNATAVGFVDAASGEFQTVALNEGQRDTLYDLKINPITFFNGVGLVNYGQKTRARNASALDRINVSRLVVYLRSQLNKLARPYIFEPNDKITRDEIKQAVESLLLELVGLRAIYDFAVVCDETNNTPARVDRNELYVDIAIEPVKAIEFIYIPLRVLNTGEI